jgi:hypothetical protein
MSNRRNSHRCPPATAHSRPYTHRGHSNTSPRWPSRCREGSQRAYVIISVHSIIPPFISIPPVPPTAGGPPPSLNHLSFPPNPKRHSPSPKSPNRLLNRRHSILSQHRTRPKRAHLSRAAESMPRRPEEYREDARGHCVWYCSGSYLRD